MKVTKEQLDKVRVALTIEVSDDKFEEAVEKAYKENIGKIRVDGFRNDYHCSAGVRSSAVGSRQTFHLQSYR